MFSSRQFTFAGCLSELFVQVLTGLQFDYLPSQKTAIKVETNLIDEPALFKPQYIAGTPHFQVTHRYLEAGTELLEFFDRI
jgi:hypothetical protein